MIWISQEQVLYLHGEIIKATGGSNGLREESLLKSALLTPLQTYDNAELFPSIIEKAARLAYGLTAFHPFVDGNKRIGAHAMLVVLEINGVNLQYTQKELSDIFLSVAAGETDYNGLLDWVKKHLQSSRAD